MKNQLKKPNRKTLYPKAFLIKTLTILPILAMLTMIAGCSKQAQTEVYQVKTITTNSELYAFLNLELLAMPVYTQEEPEKVEENAVKSVVRLDFGTNSGCGIIWDINNTSVIIVSNRHLLEINPEVQVTFKGGVTAPGEVNWISDENDVGFLVVKLSDLGKEHLTDYKMVGNTLSTEIEAGENVVQVGADQQGGYHTYEGIVANPSEYIESFQTEMVHTYCYAEPGMSGGALFDAKGYLAGMISGGAGDNDTVSISAEVLKQEYENMEIQ